jgi:hypothetical protein
MKVVESRETSGPDCQSGDNVRPRRRHEEADAGLRVERKSLMRTVGSPRFGLLSRGLREIKSEVPGFTNHGHGDLYQVRR